jgi:hypothetical protein
MPPLLLNLLLFCYCAVAFYVAITNYVTDGSDRSLINAENHIYNQKLGAAIDARFIETSAVVKNATITVLIAECVALEARLDNITLPNVTYYAEMYEEARVCNERVDALNRTFQQLKANASVHTLDNGYCQLTSDIDSDPSVLFFYRRAIVNGFDFYYYSFPTSHILATNGTVVSLMNCVPYIFSGPTLRQGYKSGIVGATVEYIEFGSNVVNITLSSGYQSVQLDRFQIWSKGF